MAISMSGVGGYLAPQLQLQQAQRSANIAEQAARALRSRAESAQKSADQEQERARQLRVDARQADQVAGSARQGLAALESLQEVQGEFDGIRQQIADVEAGSYTITTNPDVLPAKSASVNAEGQSTGSLVDTTA